MSSKIHLIDLPTHLIAFIYQYLDVREMVTSACACRKMEKALKNDFLYIELAKRDQYFYPSESDKFETWKDYFKYLQQIRINTSSGKPNIGYKMAPYRGHKFPIEAVAFFNNGKDIGKTIVSGDSNGEVFTWNYEEDEDGDMGYEKDLIIKGDASILGIKSLNEDSNMIIWTKKNTFYYFEVNMYKKTEKNAERFNLIKEFKIDEYDDPMKQIYHDADSNILYMSADLSDHYKLNNIYSCNLKSFVIDIYKYNYNSIQTNTVLNANNPVPNNNVNINQGWNAFNNNNNNNNIHIFPVINPHPIIFPNPNIILPTNTKESRKKNINYFVVTGEKLITYINREPVKKRLISEYNNKNALPNVFVFKKTTRLYESFHVDLDHILNIIPISDEEVALIGIYVNPTNSQKNLVLKIYKTNFFTLSREIVLYNGNVDNFDILYYNKVEMYYLINNVYLKKLENINVKQLKVNSISTLKSISSINCIEGDIFRIVIASDESYMAIFDIKTGKLWFNLLSGSRTVVPKSFVKHPNYEGFHLIKVTRNSIISVIGNLIREYRFTFK